LCILTVKLSHLYSIQISLRKFHVLTQTRARRDPSSSCRLSVS